MGLSKLVYIGNVGKSYDLATVVAAVAGMEGVELHLATAGGALGDRPLPECCHNHGYLGAEELEKLLATCDIGLVPMWPASCVGIPYKLGDYAKAALKIVESLGGETGDLVAKFGVGTHYVAGDVESCRAAISAALALQVPPEAFAAFRDCFDAKKIYSAYVDWVSKGLL